MTEVTQTTAWLSRLLEDFEGEIGILKDRALEADCRAAEKANRVVRSHDEAEAQREYENLPGDADTGRVRYPLRKTHWRTIMKPKPFDLNCVHSGDEVELLDGSSCRAVESSLDGWHLPAVYKASNSGVFRDGDFCLVYAHEIMDWRPLRTVNYTEGD